MSNKEENIKGLVDLWNRENYISSPSEKIKHTEVLVNQVANMFSVGEFYYCIFNFETHQIDYVSDSVEKILGVKPEDFNLEKMLSYFHPEDIEKMKEKEIASMDFKFNRLKTEQIKDYKTVYLLRYLLPKKRIKIILHQSKPINISKDGKIQQTLVVHTDVTYLNIPIDQKISFISDKYPCYYSLDPKNLVFNEFKKTRLFTDQELKIIELIAVGKSNVEISNHLFISLGTVKKHRQNILGKSDASNFTHLVANCIRNGII